MILSINQPAYLPWLGYFQRIAVSDLHIVLDHVQFEKNSFINRNKVRTSDGWCWLTVPVKTKGRFGHLSIRSLEIDNSTSWGVKHWKTICQCYGKAPYFQEHAVFVESVYRRQWKYLADLCSEITHYLLKAFGIVTPLRFSSDMNPKGSKDELILDLCRKGEADTYLSGALGRRYISEQLFNENGIRVMFQDYHHPEYQQCQVGRFEPYMAAIDLLFSCGPESHKILTCRAEPIEA